MSQHIARWRYRTEKKTVIEFEEPPQEDHGEEVSKRPQLTGRVSSGSALIRLRGDVSKVLETLIATFRAQQFDDCELFGIRVALEVAIDSILATTNQGMRLRYHLGPDGLLLDVEAQEKVAPALSDQALQLMRHFTTEVRVHETGVTLYRCLPLSN